MNNFSDRIAALSPGQLKLLKLRLKKEGIDFDIDIKRVEKSIFPAVEPAEEKEYYPLSSVQKRLFTLSQLDGNSTVYSVSSIRLIRENLYKRNVEKAFKTLIKRHKSFRTSFEFIDNEPVQRIHKKVNFAIEYFEAGFDPVDSKIGEIIKNFKHWFDLSRAPLLRVGMIKLEEKKYILIIDMHHIMSDALSKRIIREDFDCLYKELPIKELKIDYSDFSQWQNRVDVKTAIKRQETYWLNEFRGNIPVINLPTDYERPANKNFSGGYQYFKINKKIASIIKKIAIKENTTLFVIMLAIYNVFLMKVSRQKDIVVGIPTAGRNHAGLDNIIGMFVNTLALRNFPADELTFEDFLRLTRQKTLAAFENQDYLFEDLVNNVVKQRDTGGNPVFDVFFSFRAPGVSQELPVNVSDNEDSSLTSREENSGRGSTMSMFDLYFLGAEIKEEFFLVFTYSSELFKIETIERFVNYIKEIISSVTKNIQVRLKDIKISHDLGTAVSSIFPGEKDDFGF